MKRPFHPVAALVLSALVGACEPAGPLAPDTEALESDALESELATTLAASDVRGSDHGGGSLFDELAEKIPSFGGLYRNGRCAVVVVLVDMSEEQHALHVVHAAIAPLIAHPCPGGPQVTAVQGQFTYLELKRFLAASRELLEIEGVLGIHISYQQNKLVVTVASRSAAAAVIEALPRVGIPQAAVTFVLGGSGRDGGRGTTSDRSREGTTTGSRSRG